MAGDLILSYVVVGGPRLDLSGARVAGTLKVRDLTAMGGGAVATQLLDLEVDVLDDQDDSWPQRKTEHGEPLDTHHLDGISVGRLRNPQLEWRKRWLSGNAIWSPQPWRAFSAALARDGHEAEARKLAVERENERTRRGNLPVVESPRARRLALHSRLRLQAAVRAVVGVGHRRCLRDPVRSGQVSSQARSPAEKRDPVLAGHVLADRRGLLRIVGAQPHWASLLAALEAASGWLLAALLVAALTGLLKRD